MAHVPRANRHGTADDTANHASGYVASGESEHSRRSARPNDNAQFARPSRKFHGKRSLAELISECERRITWTECELAIESDPKRKAKLAHDVQIRGRFLTKLYAERDGQ